VANLAEGQDGLRDATLPGTAVCGHVTWSQIGRLRRLKNGLDKAGWTRNISNGRWTAIRNARRIAVCSRGGEGPGDLVRPRGRRAPRARPNVASRRSSEMGRIGVRVEDVLTACPPSKAHLDRATLRHRELQKRGPAVAGQTKRGAGMSFRSFKWSLPLIVVTWSCALGQEAGDPVAGQRLAEACMSCHGPTEGPKRASRVCGNRGNAIDNSLVVARLSAESPPLDAEPDPQPNGARRLGRLYPQSAPMRRNVTPRGRRRVHSTMSGCAHPPREILRGPPL
jgi:hypothetical protein